MTIYYRLTWVFFQQLKKTYESIFDAPPSNEGNFILGAFAAAGSVTAMIPLDTIKTRLVTQMTTCPKTSYKGVTDCFMRILREEGIGAFYRSLPPRLLAVVPMIAIQFGLYEGIKSQFIQQNVRQRLKQANMTLRNQMQLHSPNIIKKKLVSSQ
jgi:hypothetical protein